MTDADALNAIRAGMIQLASPPRTKTVELVKIVADAYHALKHIERRFATDRILASGYCGGTYCSDADGEVQTVRLHYSTRPQAEAAFEAITDQIDAASGHDKQEARPNG